MSVASISSAKAGSSATQSQTASQLPQQALTQNDFLQLLVAQLSQQDPMNPVSDTDFAAQMAQFSALQETQTMQGNMAGIQANALLGSTVQLQSAQGATIAGVVSAVQYAAGTPSIVVNGQPYTLSQVISVTQTPSGSQTNTLTK